MIYSQFREDVKLAWREDDSDNIRAKLDSNNEYPVGEFLFIGELKNLPPGSTVDWKISSTITDQELLPRIETVDNFIVISHKSDDGTVLPTSSGSITISADYWVCGQDFMQSSNSISLALGGLSTLTICFIDESSSYTNNTGTSIDPQWTYDFDEFADTFGISSKRMIAFDVANQNSTNGYFIYPENVVGIVKPCTIVKCPRGSPPVTENSYYLTGAWLYNEIIKVFGTSSKKRALNVYIDESGSMYRSAIASGLDPFIADYADEFEVREFSCTNEQWLRWIINVENGSAGACS